MSNFKVIIDIEKRRDSSAKDEEQRGTRREDCITNIMFYIKNNKKTLRCEWECKNISVSERESCDFTRKGGLFYRRTSLLFLIWWMLPFGISALTFQRLIPRVIIIKGRPATEPVTKPPPFCFRPPLLSHSRLRRIKKYTNKGLPRLWALIGRFYAPTIKPCLSRHQKTHPACRFKKQPPLKVS